MVARWEQQEKGEKTPTMETVSTRVRRRSEKIENIVTKMSLESTDLTDISTCSGDCKYTSGTFLSNFGIQYKTKLLIHPDQDQGENIRKRSRESDDGMGLVKIKRLRGPSLGK